MRKLFMGAVGAVAIAFAGPAAAQVHVDVPGVGVHVGSGDHNHRGYRARAQGNCREVTDSHRSPEWHRSRQERDALPLI